MNVYFWKDGAETPVYDEQGIKIDFRKLKGNEHGIADCISQFLNDMGRHCIVIEDKSLLTVDDLFIVIDR